MYSSVFKPYAESFNPPSIGNPLYDHTPYIFFSVSQLLTIFFNKLPNKLWDKDKNKFTRESNFLCLVDLKQHDMLFYKQHFYKQCQVRIDSK